ncbi:metallophosphoesterase [Rhodospirillum rubrum]|uniref:TIGR00282 family metallophosphoesterase n=1 Tax=Rhodospirillum rubrum TaxID=1085 RepID=UPI0019072E6B|nr:TIGR00282 family metallophosphoesterase [Rhodospirillum rubrum]MBK1665895.1 metallophosphoesterase [Rhodospirillum rubrum]MBK1676278.1 metallophosphoesterase [Rhodospirillum rubrum]
MNILYCGDVVGRSGRTALLDALPGLKKDLALDLVVVCGENSAHGFGISTKICDEFLAAGIDVVTTGNHVWDQREILPYLDRQHRLIRPANFPPGTPGVGHVVVDLARGRKALVIQVMGRLFMDPLDCPFRAVDEVMTRYRLGATVQAVIVDIHAEATSEKMAMGHHCDGRVSLVVGSHSHVPTADARVLKGGSGYMSDAGMCGDYQSVIGMVPGPAVHRFTRKTPTDRLTPADGPGTVCGVFVQTDDRSGLALRCEPLRLGGDLAPAMPILS